MSSSRTGDNTVALTTTSMLFTRIPVATTTFVPSSRVPFSGYDVPSITPNLGGEENTMTSIGDVTTIPETTVLSTHSAISTSKFLTAATEASAGPTTGPAPSAPLSNLHVIVGGAVGGFLVLISTLLLFVCYLRRRRARDRVTARKYGTDYPSRLRSNVTPNDDVVVIPFQMPDMQVSQRTAPHDQQKQGSDLAPFQTPAEHQGVTDPEEPQNQASHIPHPRQDIYMNAMLSRGRGANEMAAISELANPFTDPVVHSADPFLPIPTGGDASSRWYIDLVARRVMELLRAQDHVLGEAGPPARRGRRRVWPLSAFDSISWSSTVPPMYATDEE